MHVIGIITSTSTGLQRFTTSSIAASHDSGACRSDIESYGVLSLDIFVYVLS